MQDNTRLQTMHWLLKTALDNEEEYLYQGEMSDYVRTYAADAVAQLDTLFRAAEPSPAEIELCIAALSDPERIARGKSTRLLLWLRERSQPLLQALARSSDPHLRIFALETGSISLLGPRSYMPLYGSIDMKRQLLDDPDEDVRLAAIAATAQTIQHNQKYIEQSLQRGSDNPMVGLFYQLVARLDDPVDRVRAAAAEVLEGWAAYTGKRPLSD